VVTNLNWIGERARREPELEFTSLYHHIYDEDNLRACYDALPRDRAAGEDGVTKEEYGKNLEENLREMSSRLRRMGYRPGPKRRVYIPKAGSAKGRPLGISNFEDKIVEEATLRTLEPIYEAVFEESSYGYRPGRNQHGCLDALGRTIQQKKVSYVVEADIKGFFDKVNHDWLVKFLRHRIGDERVIRLIIRMLKSGIMEDGLTRASEEGTPQGSKISPLLSNIYLHYVLDVWFRVRIKKGSRGEAYYYRFADDFVACFQYREDAEKYLRQLRERMKEFGLELSEEKTRSIEFGRYARENARRRGRKPEEFTFLGFTHYCGKSRNGNFKVKRKTSRKKLGESLHRFTGWVKKARTILRKGELIRQARIRVIGYLNYYAITDNSRHVSTYVYYVKRILFKWLNRKSQRKAYTWEGFLQALSHIGWPSLRVRKDLNPYRRAEAF